MPARTHLFSGRGRALRPGRGLIFAYLAPSGKAARCSTHFFDPHELVSWVNKVRKLDLLVKTTSRRTCTAIAKRLMQVARGAFRRPVKMWHSARLADRMEQYWDGGVLPLTPWPAIDHHLTHPFSPFLHNEQTVPPVTRYPG